MADLDERLTQLLSDPDTVNKILAVANAIQAQRDSIHPEQTKQDVSPQQNTNEPDLSALLSSLLTEQPLSSEDVKHDATPTAEPNTALPPIAAILPQLLQAMSGQGNLIKQERVELLRAMRPYLKENRLQSIERALKMANVTKAATSAMHLLGR